MSGIVGGLFVPRSNEWAAIMSDGGRQARVIGQLQQQVVGIDAEPDLVATVGRAYVATGDFGNAVLLFERYTKMRPSDAEGWAVLAECHKGLGDLAAQEAALRKAIALSPRAAWLADLATLHHARGDTKQEFDLLRQHEARLTVAHGLRLRMAHLYAERDDLSSATRVLMQSDVLARPVALADNVEERLYLAELLSMAGQGPEVVRLGRIWIGEWHADWLSARLLDRTINHLSVGDASELAAAVVRQHPEIRLFMARKLANAGFAQVARFLLSGWADSARSPSFQDIAAFMSVCQEQKASDIIWESFGRLLTGSASIEVLGNFSEAMASAFGIGSLAPFWPMLPPEIIQLHPLLGARLAFHEQNPVVARWLLDRVDLVKADEGSRQIWLSILTSISSPQEAFETLRLRRLDRQLPATLLPSYARIAGELGQEAEYEAARVQLLQTSQ